MLCWRKYQGPELIVVRQKYIKNLLKTLVVVFLSGLFTIGYAENGSPQAPKAVLDKVEKLTLKKILNNNSDAVSYSKTQRCIDPRYIKHREILSDRFVLIELKEGRKFLIQLKHPCQGLRLSSTVMFQRQGMRFCKGDGIRARINTAGGISEWGGVCRVPGFEPVSASQVAMLREGLKTGRIE